jgi:hypothetical protein
VPLLRCLSNCDTTQSRQRTVGSGQALQAVFELLSEHFCPLVFFGLIAEIWLCDTPGFALSIQDTSHDEFPLMP